MLNGILELELERVIGQGKDEIGGGYSGGGRGWVPHVLRQKNIITSGSYGRGRAGRGSRGGPFPVELVIGQGKDEIGGGYSGGGRGWVPHVLRQKNIITSGSYGRGRAGRGSRGGPFPVEL
ncbi:hypothetical protein GOBAR_AA22125 [Gossypium barbadense]|uniref:Uncharacterized protein n=1 Tax=Gossypium barbadense TaxID=3634 RepID=A0A2P5X5C9_GOSBA|nr:hypothetical protein GOBAR_AA22125 [Gossypium barbadense]